jgi:hypothetical protein
MASDVALNLGDCVVAVQEWLADGPELAEAVAGRVFGHGLPDDEATSMPRPCVVVTEAGGYTDDLPEEMDRARLDVRSYGATPDQAKTVAILVRRRMRELSRSVRNGIVISAPSRVGGYIPYREPIGDWPAFLRSYLVPYSDRVVA